MLRVNLIMFQLGIVGFALFPGETVMAQCEFDVCGYWYSENYNAGVPVEYMSIDVVGELLVCTKVLGDWAVPTGLVTWQGVPTSCTFSGDLTLGNGQTCMTTPITIAIHSTDYITVLPYGLEFHRTNTGHFDYVGVDYSMFPVSCIECESPIPTVFTPNGDGLNDLLEFVCGARSTRFSITNRWGATVYEVVGAQPSWDGRDAWNPCPEGVYFWSMIDATARTGSIKNGVVHLLR